MNTTHAVAYFGAGLLVGGLVIGIWNSSHTSLFAKTSAGSHATSTSMTEKNDAYDLGTVGGSGTTAVNTGTTETGTASVSAADQPEGSSVVVKHLELPATGWVAIHEIVNGSLGNALGATREEKGSYDDLTVQLLRPMHVGGTYAAVVYKDDGDRIFERHKDAMMTDAASGSVIQSTFTATNAQ